MSLPRVLLIEDEPALARGLSDTLRANGFDVTVAADGERGLDAAVSGQADLILLDVMLPKINGYEICRAVRAQGIDVPIVMLTAKGQEQDVILGLNLGADDYITKPFRTGELIARARAFLRRRGPAPTAVQVWRLRHRPDRAQGAARRRRGRADGEGVCAAGLLRHRGPAARCRATSS